RASRHPCALLATLFVVLTRRPPGPPLFPYTTLFRSGRHDRHRRPDRTPPLPRVRARAAPSGDRAPGPSGQHDRHRRGGRSPDGRSEEHTSELQSRENLVCRLLLEKKKKRQKKDVYST